MHGAAPGTNHLALRSPRHQRRQPVFLRSGNRAVLVGLEGLPRAADQGRQDDALERQPARRRRPSPAAAGC